MCSLGSFLYRLLISFSLLKQARNKTLKFIRWSVNPIHTQTQTHIIICATCYTCTRLPHSKKLPLRSLTTFNKIIREGYKLSSKLRYRINYLYIFTYIPESFHTSNMQCFSPVEVLKHSLNIFYTSFHTLLPYFIDSSIYFYLSQDEDVFKASLIEVNTDLVEKACLVIRSAVASSMDWGDIHLLVKEAQSRGDPVASCIHGLKLESNQITLLLQ